MIRAGAFYAASGWLLVQVATQVFPFFNVPNWAVRWVVIAAIVGFPFMLAFAWLYEFTPQGLKRESEIDPAESITRRTGKQLDRWIIAIMAAAIVLLLTNQFVLRKDDNAPTSPEIPAKSIAVLPFTDLSPAHDQEYFSDGMAEELLNALAKLKDLKVAGRTSSFSFKGKNADLRVIGKALSVANILEGSLRKQGRQGAHHGAADPGVGWIPFVVGDLRRRYFGCLCAAGTHRARDRGKARSGAEGRSATHRAGDDDEPGSVCAVSAGHADFSIAARARIFPTRFAQLEQAIRLDPKFAHAHARLAAIMAIAPTYMKIDSAALACCSGGACAFGERARSRTRRAVRRARTGAQHPS